MLKYWEEFTANEFKSIDHERTIAVLPTAAIEQHGPHLPVGTDYLINKGMIKVARNICPDNLDVRVLPYQAIGKSNEHIWAGGTVTLEAGTALKAWTEIGHSVFRAGIHKMVIVNSHGGNLDLISIVARELRVRFGMYVVKCQWSSFGHPQDLYSTHEKTYGIHGGDVETSLMLHFRPELVNMAFAQDFRSSAEHDSIKPTGLISYGWSAMDLNSDGVVGNARIATNKKGLETAEYQASGFIELLQKISDVDSSQFQPSI